MTKPTVYIIVQGGLVQEVYVKAMFAANTEVVICDMDTTEPAGLAEINQLIKELPNAAHKVY